jgi:serine/threonine protein kinase
MAGKEAANHGKGTTPPKSGGIQADARLEIPGYTLTEVLGQGGQAAVYAATQLSTGHKVAVKLIHAHGGVSKRSAERFLRDSHALASLDHPNIARIIDAGVIPSGDHYLVMEYVSGLALDDYARAHADLPALLRMFCKICMAVEEAHSNRVIHRDIKPGNVLVDQQGEPHLVDFGLAELVAEREPISTQAPSAGFIGSLPWASPEQIEDDLEKTDARTDVYSLGVMLYQISSGGRFPYDVVGYARDILNNISTSPPAPLIPSLKARFGSNAVRPVELEAIVFKALSKRKSDRYQSASEFARSIEAYLSNESIQTRLVKPTSFASRLKARLSFMANKPKSRQARSEKRVGLRYRIPSRWPTIKAFRALYDGLPIRHALPAWDQLTSDRQDWFAEQVIAALLAIPKASAREVSRSIVIDSKTIEMFRQMGAFFEQIADHLTSQPGAPPPPSQRGSAGWDDEDELRKIWLRLKAEQRAILRFMRENSDSVLNYKAIALNLELSRVPGDIAQVRDLELLSNRTVAKHCKPMETRPLSLIKREGERTSIRLTLKGDRIVKLHSGERFT